MKNYVKALAVTLLTGALCIGGVDAATQSRRINTNACDTVYTNYYLFLDANETAFYTKDKLSNITHVNAADFSNNFYQISNFDTNNMGYGQVTINRNSSTSSDGITSLSLYDFYDYYFDVLNHNGAYSKGTNSYITHYNYYTYINGSEEPGKGGVNLRNFPIRTLVAATLEANSTITRESSYLSNPFKLKIDRRYTGSLTGSPIRYTSTKDYYLHPAVYYIQYCSPRREEPKRTEYTITYHGNGSNVTNVPGIDREYDDTCTSISKVEPKREGYEFLGWSRYSDATNGDSKYAPGARYCGELGNLDLYAVWKKKDVPITPQETYYHIWYSANTSDPVTNMPADITVNSNNDAYIDSRIPIRSGYEFLGWSTDASSPEANPSYKGGTLYTDRKDLTLYAIWRKKSTPVAPPENPKTGVEDYLLPFGGVVGVSGLGLSILKKRKFKQF